MLLYPRSYGISSWWFCHLSHNGKNW